MDIQFKKVLSKSYLEITRFFLESNKTYLTNIKKEIEEEENNYLTNSDSKEDELNEMNLFFRRLNLKYPTITRNENQLCGLLKLNLSSKEIAIHTRSTVHTVEVARVRLRKKLGLTNKQINLTSFIHTI